MWQGRPWPALFSVCVCVSQCFLAGCTASWEVGCSVPESGTYSSLSPRQLTTGCSTVTPAITCTRACGGTVCRGNAWHTQTASVRLAGCLPLRVHRRILIYIYQSADNQSVNSPLTLISTGVTSLWSFVRVKYGLECEEDGNYCYCYLSKRGAVLGDVCTEVHWLYILVT